SRSPARARQTIEIGALQSSSMDMCHFKDASRQEYVLCATSSASWPLGRKGRRVSKRIGAAASEGPIPAGQPNRVRFDEADNKTVAAVRTRAAAREEIPHVSTIVR